MAPRPIRKEAGTVGIPSIVVKAANPLRIKSVNGVFALTFTSDLQSFREKALKSNYSGQQRLFVESLKRRRSRNKRTILFLDECQDAVLFINEQQFKRFFIFSDALCRQTELGLNVIIACRPSFFDHKEIARINLGRLFNPITLGPLGLESAKAIISRGAEQLDYREEAINRILFLTGRHPCLLQFICHKVFNKACTAGKSLVTDEVVKEVFGKICDEIGNRSAFHVLYQEVENNDLAFGLLKQIAMVADDENRFVSVSSLGREDSGYIKKGTKTLCDNGILSRGGSPENPTVTFAVCPESILPPVCRSAYHGSPTLVLQVISSSTGSGLVTPGGGSMGVGLVLALEIKVLALKWLCPGR